MAGFKRTFKKVYKKKSGKKPDSEVPEEVLRVRTPRGREVIGTIDQRLGASKMRVKCLDGKTRLCRVPGRMKRRLWVREGDVVIVEPWELGGDEKGDLVYKYRPNQVQFLKKKGILKQIEEFEEF